MVHRRKSEGPRQSPADGFEPSQVAIASEPATADRNPRSALADNRVLRLLSLLSGLLGARSRSFMFPNRDGRAKLNLRRVSNITSLGSSLP